MIKNPYLSQSTTTCIKNNREINIFNTSCYNIQLNFNVIYVLYLSKDILNNKDIKNKYISKELYVELKDAINIKIIPKHILNEQNKLLLTLLINEDIKNIDEPVILAYSLININRHIVTNFISQFSGFINLVDMFGIVLLNEYMIIQDNKHCNNIINNIIETNYWTNIKNCNINITKHYRIRKFNYDFSKIIKYDNYKFDKLLINNNNKIYYSNYIINNNNFFNIDEFNYLINKYSGKAKYLLILNSLVSKDYCHLILNNNHILKIISSSLLNKYTFIIEYCISYAWATMYIEETIKRSNIVETDRFVFNIDIACNLPYFPCYPENPHTSPYMPILVNDNIIKADVNNLGVKMQFLMINNKIVFGNEIDINQSYRLYDDNLLLPGIVDFVIFKNRVNVFLFESYYENDIFKDINWDNIALTGSLIACCLPRYNPIMLNTLTNNNKLDFIEYVNAYYKNADLDIMCTLNNIEFIKKSLHVYDIIDKNISTQSNTTTLTLITKVNIFVSIIFFQNNFIEGFTIEKIIENPNHIKIKEFLYEYYKKNKYSNNLLDYDKIKNDVILDKYKINYTFNNNVVNEIDSRYKLYFDLININDIHITIKKSSIDFIEINENFKYKITNILLKREIEIFPIKYDTFFSSVSQFHLPIVRAYYTNNNVYILPSCISSCMTMMNIDYKYFMCSKNPITIIEKYKKRGFGTYLNREEQNIICKYIHISKFNPLNLIEIIKKNVIIRYFTSHAYTSNVFKIKDNNMLLNDIFTIEQNNIIDAYVKIFNNNNFYKMNDVEKIIFNKNCINNEGNIKILKKWLFEACYDL